MSAPQTTLMDLTQAVIDRAGDDEAFLATLKADPEAALRDAFGVSFAPTDVLAEDELDHVVGGANSIGGVTSSVTALNIHNMDLETALMAVQNNRANLLESQLKSQMEAVQGRNETIATLNSALVTLGGAEGKDGNAGWSDHGPGKPIGADHRAWDDAINNDPKLFKALKDIGIDVTNSKTDNLTNFGSEETRSKIKQAIDSESGSQQMDMLRLQGLSNKRNEAFDVMTNFIKKMQDSRSSIIGNMR